jgi:iron complex outermembrane receptor protein
MLMRRTSFFALASVSLGALITAAPAAAQAPNPITPDEANQCASLPTPAERAACLAAQTEPEATAQDTGDVATMQPEESAEQQAESSTIVVTGSRIRRSAFNSPDPITVISPDLERRGGENSTAEILQTNPVAAGSFQITDVISAGTFVTNGGPGAETVSLRGLGAERTLVLINGRRAGPAGTRGAIAGFDLNVLPSSLIRSVEILKTGASSIYGSDAVAGVINLLTKTSTDGLELRGFVSAPFDSGGEQYNISGAYGKDFGRGHVLIGADYTMRERLKRRQRDFLDCSEEFLRDESGNRLDVLDPRTGEPRCVGAIHNALLITNVGLGTPTVNGVPFTTFQFNNPGDRFDEFLPPIPSTALFTAPAGYYPFPVACGATTTPAQIEMCNRGQGLQNQYGELHRNSDVSPQSERYSFWADGAYELTDNIELVGELLYSRRKTEFVSARQLFFFQFLGNSPLLVNAFCDPTVDPCQLGDAGDPFNAGFSGNVLIRPVVLIPTGNSTDVQYYRGVGGLRGDFGSNFLGGNLRWDTYLQFSRSDGDYTFPRVFQDAVEKMEWRTRACAGTVTRIRGAPCVDIDFTDPRVLAGNWTPAEHEFLFGDETGNTRFDQLTAEASVAGNVFELPAGPLGIALGVQYRRDEIDDQPGEISQAGNVWGQSVAGRTAGYSETKEAFGEVQIPLIRNTPFIQDLSFSGAARVTNVYAERDDDGASHKSNNNWTYKIGLNWQTTDWLRFRGSIGTSYRSPALFEQFLGNQTGFLGQAAIDPCVGYAADVIAGTLPAIVGERCAALGIAGDYGGAGSSALIVTGGGIGVLEPETSKAKTISAIFTPSRGLWDGMRFSVAVDYFDIEVKGEIAQLGAGNIIFRCMNSDNYPDDPVCGLFDRAAPGSAEFPNILEVRDAYVNINSQRNRGVDLTAQLSQDLGRFGNFGAVGQMTWQIEDVVELFTGTESTFEGEAGEPIWVGDFKFTWDKGPWGVFYGLNVIGGTSDEQNLRNANAGQICPFSRIRGGNVCPVYRLDAQFYHSASVTRDIGDRFALTLGVRNIFDTTPPRVSGAFGPISPIGNSPIFGSQYDFIGRRAFVNVRAKL